MDLFIEDFNPLALASEIKNSLGLEEERFEVYRKGDNLIFHFFATVGPSVVAIEVVSKTHLGRITQPPLFREVVGLEREGIFYWTLSLEAYAVLQATRPDGPRSVDVARFQLVADKVDWEKAEVMAEELGVLSKFKQFRQLVRV